MAVVELPAFEFVQQRLITDIQTPGGLLTIPTGLLEYSEYQFLFSMFCSTRRDILQRHVVFFWFDGRGRRVTLLILQLRQIHVHVRKDEISFYRVFQLPDVAGPVIPKKR